MKIAWFCIPAHGHTNPTLGLVRELTAAGHDIVYFSFEQFRKKIEEAGARFISCDGHDFEMEDKENADRVGKDVAFATELLVNSTLALDEMVAEKVGEIQPDLIVSDSVAYWGKLTAMKYQIPYVSSTTTFAFNKFSSRYMKQGLGDMLKLLFSMPKINKQIKRLQDKGYPVRSMLDIIQNDNDTNTIVYTSPYFQPCADTFSDKYCFIGPSIRPVEQPVEKTADKTIYISMGTVVRNEAFYRSCIDALRETDYQVIVSTGTSHVHFDDLPEHIQVYEAVDQIAVLQIADVFVTHCGMNSVSEALYFGVPLVLCPQTSEQGAVAARTEELGAGITMKGNGRTELLDALHAVLNTSGYQASAQKISESFRNCGGAKKARDFLESLVK